ncbi:thymidylate kinase [Haloarcula virus HVTV-2]|uniref:dTMP kinase n=1 Tax=Haloarcula vallismortis tailed virus 1 TaxID=1262528 RepID=L7TNP0_9CAUD|nr:thymidylate kinase [Haloarcula vallismortis tailed virus 1]AGC34467.1 thymidylate kinase [Haloarcula vallismortis tailed virus 1]UBF22905.1 thymidylate kinase [Haloarcula virus HVTV-2]
MPGHFITVEGLDGAGKTLVVKAIKRKFDAETTCEPSEFWTGKQVRKALRSETPAFTDFFLFMADRHYHIEEFIKPKVENGQLVVSDRFSDSTLAYQPVQLQDELENPVEWMSDVMAPWKFMPDLTIYLDVSVDTALERADKEEKYEKRETLEQVKENYEYLINRDVDDPTYRVVDGEQSKKDVREEVLAIVEEEL